jgi:HEAT repeat protein
LWELQGQHQSFTIPLARDAPSAVKTAVSALESHRADERRAALRTLAQMNHPAAYAVLVSAVRHPMRDVRVDAAFMLAKETKYQDAEAVPGLLDALTDDDPRVCLAAIDALGKIGDGAAVPDLLDILINEKDGDIRWTATNALGQIGPAAVPGLREALRDEDWKVRRSAAEALWAMGEPEAVPDLIEALVDKNDVVRQAVQSALKAMGYVAVRGLTAALNARDPQIRQAVATVLIEIGTPEAVMAVQQWRGRQSK